MIAREEAEKMVEAIGNYPDRDHKSKALEIVNKIYDSIGRCADCELVDICRSKWKDEVGKVREYTEYRCKNLDLNSDCSFVEPDGFCESFRKRSLSEKY
jgi:hypothetical protein